VNHPVSIDLIKARLCDRIDQLVMQLYPNATMARREWLLGDVFGAPGSSMSICREGAKTGVWQDFAGTAGGDVLDLVAAGACDGDVKAAIGWAIDWLGLGGMNAEQLRRQEEKAKAAREQAQAKARDDAERRKRQAKAIFLAGEPYAGSPAERYMLGRAMDLTRLPRMPSTLRYHPKVWNAESGGRELPAMLAPVNDAVTGEQLAVHRTFLELHADGRVTKARLKDAKTTLGPRKGGLIPLTRGESGKPLKQMPEGEWLAVSEGIENGYSVAIARPEKRIAAAIALDNLAELRLPPQCGGLFVLADNDAKDAPRAAFERAMNRLSERRIAFQIIRPPAGFKDFNDWLQALALEAFVQAGEHGRVA
jgi:hypothetical protein